MYKFAIFTTLAAALSFSALPAEAGGWGSRGGNTNSSGGLINVSPAIQTGNINALSGLGVLNNSSILSGNVLSGIVNGANNNVGHGNVSGNKNVLGNGIIGGGLFNSSHSGKRR